MALIFLKIPANGVYSIHGWDSPVISREHFWYYWKAHAQYNMQMYKYIVHNAAH